jgi:hypothetical protein
MSKPFIFVSCGQFSDAEKNLGKAICKVVTDISGHDAFFAEQAQDLKGLNENILDHLRDCSGFITVLHARGEIKRPDQSVHIRASVWIEQEIAITAYIRHVEKREIPVIAFIHKSVGREGIRDLLHLNPITFANEMDVLAALPERLRAWGTLQSTSVVPLIESSVPVHKPDEHLIGRLIFSVVNNTSHRITQLSGTLKVPTGTLRHWSNTYGFNEEHSTDDRYRIFRFDETNIRAIQPHTTGHITNFDYCITCGIQDTGETPQLGGVFVSEREVELKVWIEGREYQTLKTMKELLQVARAS